MSAVESYSVTVEPKNSTHPFYQQGSKKGYVINGEQGPTLILEVDKTYTFNINTPNHPFYFTGDDTGAKQGQDRLALTTPLEQGQLNFTVPSKPAEFYYQCDYHPKMGGKVITVVKVSTPEYN